MRRASIQGMQSKKSTSTAKKTNAYEVCQRMKLEMEIETAKLKQEIDI